MNSIPLVISDKRQTGSQIAAGHLVIIKRVAVLTPLYKLSPWKGIFRQGLESQLHLCVNTPATVCQFYILDANLKKSTKEKLAYV